MLEKLLYWLGFPLVRLYAWLMLKMDVLSQAPMPDGPKIIAVNHPSTIDPFFMPLLNRCRMSLMLLDQVFQVPLLGLYLRWSGHVRVVPGQGEAVLERARQLLARGRTVVIFPEGLISPREGGFHRARSGVARLALSSGAPVIPVGIHLPRERRRVIISHIDGTDLTGEWYFRGPYHVTIGESMRFSGDAEDREQVAQVAQTIMQRIIHLAEQSALRQQSVLSAQPVPA